MGTEAEERISQLCGLSQVRNRIQVYDEFHDCGFNYTIGFL